MSYNTPTEFRLFAVPSGSLNNTSDAVIQRFLDVAASEINAALIPHHTLPLNTGSYGSSSDLAVIYDAEITIASYRLLQYRGMKPNTDGTNDQVLERRYNEITNPEFGLLTRLSRGEYLLFKEADATPTVHEGRVKSYGRASRTTRYYSEDGTEYV